MEDFFRGIIVGFATGILVSIWIFVGTWLGNNDIYLYIHSIGMKEQEAIADSYLYNKITPMPKHYQVIDLQDSY